MENSDGKDNNNIRMKKVEFGFVFEQEILECGLTISFLSALLLLRAFGRLATSTGM